MKVLLIGKSWGEASTRYRLQPVMSALSAAGHSTAFLSSDLNLLRKLKLLRDAASFDVVFIQRKLFSKVFLQLLRKRVQKIVFDFDDAIFVKSSGQHSDKRSREFGAICQSADLILSGNRYLAENAVEFGAAENRIEIVPTCVETKMYEGNPIKRSATTLVWIGSSSTRRYLEMLRPVLDRLGDMRLGIELKVIADFEFTLETMPVTNAAWTQESEAFEIGECHIGIAPMINNAWTRGKCALKIVQYMAAGLPVISDLCGANAEIVETDVTGFLAENESDWIDAVLKLHNELDLAQRYGDAGREKIMAHFDMTQRSESVVKMLEELKVS